MSTRQHRVLVGRSLGIAIIAALGGMVAGTASAQLVPKQLSGPPAEFTSMQSPDVAEGAIYSHSALLPASRFMTKSNARGGAALPVENGKLRFAVMMPGNADIDLVLSGPRGQKLRSTDASKANVATHFGIEGAQVPARMFDYDNLPKGLWSLQLDGYAAKAGNPGFLLLEGDDRTELASYPGHRRQLVGETMNLTAQLTGVDAKGEAVVGFAAGWIERATLQVTAPDGSVENHVMHDDGLHDDGVAGDGIFGGGFTALQAGDHVAQVMIEGVDASGNRILRTAEHLLPFVDRSISLTGNRARATQAKAAGSRLAINIPVSAAKSDAHYRGYAEVWGRDGKGDAVPVAWVGGMVAVEGGQLDFGFDERWVAKASAQGPFELRNLRIEDPDSFVTVASAKRMALDMPQLRTRQKAADVVVDELMTMGPRPSGDVAAKGVGKRLLLVHGYCSGGVWPASQFSTASSFLDQNQNRTHDTFARMVGNFGSTWNSFGIVAHSQGGAAALHLYTYYWSGLDNATGARLIQSVGSPYQGTNLAGILAKLGNWFGVGCGTNNNLTYSGASSWLAGIPSWARAKVNYYTTSFDTAWYRWDYCNAATDLVLSDPEDGTTEKAYGQLPGAINRGHATGQCHTTGMRDPAQYLNASRNATMNANAAR